MERKSKGLSVAALVLSILGVMLSLFLGIGIVFALLAFILGFIAIRKKQGNMAVVSFVLGLAGIIISVFIIVFTAFVLNMFRSESAADSKPDNNAASFTIGETVDVKNYKNESLFTAKLTNVTKTNERSTDETVENPLEVIKISFEYENISVNRGFYLGSSYLSVLDENQNLLRNYPMENNRPPQSTIVGSKSDGVIYYSIFQPTSKIKIIYHDNADLERNTIVWEVNL